MVREAAMDVAGRRGIAWASTKDLTEHLSRGGQLPSTVAKLILDLRNLRYKMADQEQQDITSTTATAYVVAAANVAEVLRTVPDGALGDQ